MHGLRHGATASQRVSSDCRGTLHSSCAVESSNEFQLRSIARSTSYTKRPRRTQVHALANARRCATSRARASAGSAASPSHALRTFVPSAVAIAAAPASPIEFHDTSSLRSDDDARITWSGPKGSVLGDHLVGPKRVGLRANAHGVSSTDRIRCALSALRGRVLRPIPPHLLSSRAW